ncbi:ATP-binding protein [Pseudonocardia humida]|uniref:ATP-binding protein n=1 Tax=Pseudonocardia humida TaxID=2800819 RepID=A0ABT1A1V7_9PSEU|nr:ATP-binding protein [Pseudonocardia humida]MCO1656987.1 ATP-binding protein [Pseudonocardia humida]
MSEPLSAPSAGTPCAAPRHAAAFFASPAALVAQIVPVVRAGLDRGVPVALALPPEIARAVGAALGGLDRVTVLDHPDDPAGRCGQTMAVRLAARLRELAGDGPVSLVAAHDSRFDGPDGRFWVELEAAFNVVLAGTASDLRCFYPEQPLHRAVTDGTLRNHPALVLDGELRPNPLHRPPREVLAEIPVPPPALLGPPDLVLVVESARLSDIRGRVEAALIGAGYARARAEDVVFAVNEITTNAVHHGAPPAELHMWVVERACVFEVHDRGRLDDPLPGLRPPVSTQRSGWGVWIARQTCSALHVWSDRHGTHVRMHTAA